MAIRNKYSGFINQTGKRRGALPAARTKYGGFIKQTAGNRKVLRRGNGGQRRDAHGRFA